MKKNTKEKLSVEQQINLLYAYNGIAWILGGIFQLFEGIIFYILIIIAMLISIFLLWKVIRSESEIEDEMSTKNLMQAKATTLTYMETVLGIITLTLIVVKKIPFFSNMNIYVQDLIVPVFFIYLGIQDLCIGILFHKYEREEDECLF